MKRKAIVLMCVVSIFCLATLAGCSTGSDGKIENASDNIKKLSEADAKTELKSYIKKNQP
ncbi:hypothetical protein [Enterococcus rivorum]|uniref:hypothetical protein n=1 Tax=Enterococcus rivorum TaxID=762845 RepID=UPI003638DA73